MTTHRTDAIDVRSLSVPVMQAPMAGGPSTPELAAAVTDAGGLGFLAGGYLAADALRDQLVAFRSLTSGPAAVNLFVPEAHPADPGDVDAYRTALLAFIEATGVERDVPPDPGPSDDHWDAKLSLLLEEPPAVVTFTFGLPARSVADAFARSGTLVGLTVTTAEEAREAMALEPAFLIAQGEEAGGHRGQFDQSARPSAQTTDALVRDLVHDDVVDVPVVAAGGVADVPDAQRLLDAGAAAVQLGTLFLTVAEAGTRAAHRKAILAGDGGSNGTVVTWAFSGRPARALSTRFTSAMRPHEIVGYPNVHYLTSPVRKAAAAAGDATLLNLWAGTGFRGCREETAGELLSRFSSLRRGAGGGEG